MRPLAPPLAKVHDGTQYRLTWRDSLVAVPSQNEKLFFDETIVEKGDVHEDI